MLRASGVGRREIRWHACCISDVSGRVGLTRKLSAMMAISWMEV